MSFKSYHFHLYYSVEQIELARSVVNEVGSLFNLRVGHLWDKLVGPHPVCSCQLTVSKDKFEQVVSWLLLNRKGLDVFIHPEGDDDLKDHSVHIMWIGKSYDLNLEIFK